MRSQRPNEKSLARHYVAFMLLAGSLLWFTTLAATAQQPPEQQAPTAAQAPATTQQPSTAQAPDTAQVPASAPQSQAASGQPGENGPENVHVMVGHSLLIHTPSRVKRILTGNPAVIESVVTSLGSW